jgi:tetratricopeptide (TPR) repeat protein
LPWRRALEIEREVLGPGHPKYGRSLNNLADAFFRLHRWDEATDLYKPAVDVLRRSYGPDHLVTSDVLNNLANAYMRQESWDEAERTFEQVLEILRARVPEDDERVQRVIADLAESRERSARVGGDRDADPRNLERLAHDYEERGDYATAERLADKALELRRRSGVESRGLADSLLTVALLRFRTGRLTEAGALYEEALAGLALARQATGDLDAAERLFREALDIVRRTYGERSTVSVRELCNLR